MSPKVSIIYLTRNGGETLTRSLEAVFSQTADFTYEVIAIDSGSTDGTLDNLAAYPIRVEKILPEEFNFGLTRDFGFSLSRGEILVTLSQDAVPASSDWLKQLCTPFDDPEVAAVQGEEYPPENRSLFFWDKVRLFYFTREAKRWARRHQGLGLSFVNCAVRRSAWEATPLGRVEMSEDKVFQKRLTEKGFKIVKQPKALVLHSHMYNLKTLAKRCENEGLGWKNAGMTYSISDLARDMVNPLVILVLIYGIVTFQVRRLAELLFPWLRPIFLFRGNHFADRFIR